MVSYKSKVLEFANSENALSTKLAKGVNSLYFSDLNLTFLFTIKTNFTSKYYFTALKSLKIKSF